MEFHREHHEDDSEHTPSEFSYEEDADTEQLNHKKQVRRMLEDKLERKRLKEELDELDGEFDWNELDR